MNFEKLLASARQSFPFVPLCARLDQDHELSLSVSRLLGQERLQGTVRAA